MAQDGICCPETQISILSYSGQARMLLENLMGMRVGKNRKQEAKGVSFPYTHREFLSLYCLLENCRSRCPTILAARRWHLATRGRQKQELQQDGVKDHPAG